MEEITDARAGVDGHPEIIDGEKKKDVQESVAEMKLDSIDVLDRAALYQRALKDDNVSPWSRGMLIMYLILFIAMMSTFGCFTSIVVLLSNPNFLQMIPLRGSILLS